MSTPQDEPEVHLLRELQKPLEQLKAEAHAMSPAGAEMLEAFQAYRKARLAELGPHKHSRVIDESFSLLLGCTLLDFESAAHPIIMLAIVESLRKSYDKLTQIYSVLDKTNGKA